MPCTVFVSQQWGRTEYKEAIHKLLGRRLVRQVQVGKGSGRRGWILFLAVTMMPRRRRSALLHSGALDALLCTPFALLAHGWVALLRREAWA